MWVFVERYGLPSALSRVTGAALDSHARCESLLHTLSHCDNRLARPVAAADSEFRLTLSGLDTEIGRLEAYWYLVFRCSNAEQWRRASARCRRMRRHSNPLFERVEAGAVQVIRDARRSGHPRRAGAALLALQSAQSRGTHASGNLEKAAEFATLLRRDVEVWRWLSRKPQNPDDSAIERSLMRAVGRERERGWVFTAARSTEKSPRPADLQKPLKRLQRLIWQLELIGATGSDDLGFLLADLKKVGAPLAELHAVIVFAAQLDRLLLPVADRRRLEKALSFTRSRLHREAERDVEWPKNDLALRLRREIRRWVWRGYTVDRTLTGEGI